jgi:hypothetical protein
MNNVFHFVAKRNWKLTIFLTDILLTFDVEAIAVSCYEALFDEEQASVECDRGKNTLNSSAVFRDQVFHKRIREIQV